MSKVITIELTVEENKSLKGILGSLINIGEENLQRADDLIKIAKMALPVFRNMRGLGINQQVLDGMEQTISQQGYLETANEELKELRTILAKVEIGEL